EAVDLLGRLLEAPRRLEGREETLGLQDVGDAVGREDDDVTGSERHVASYVGGDLLLLAEAPGEGGWAEGVWGGAPGGPQTGGGAPAAARQAPCGPPRAAGRSGRRRPRSCC